MKPKENKTEHEFMNKARNETLYQNGDCEASALYRQTLANTHTVAVFVPQIANTHTHTHTIRVIQCKETRPRDEERKSDYRNVERMSKKK